MPAPPTYGYLIDGHAYRASRRSQLVAAALSALFVVLALLMLVMMGRFAGQPGSVVARLAAISMPAGHQSREKATAHAAAPTHQRIAPQPAPPVVPPPPPVPTRNTLNLIPMSRADMAAADLSRMARAQEGGSTSGDSKTAYGPGEGPGGAHLYNAEWYREPSHAEIAGYLPHGAPPGSWAMIACRTIEHFHVDSCQQLGESPPGSGLSRALRDAAWQFLIRPPRLNGHPQIGTWVRIRFDFTRKGRDEPDEAAAAD
jgi:protein TonB